MIDFFRILKKHRARIRRLEKEKQSIEEAARLVLDKSTPEHVIEKILLHNMEWYNYRELAEDKQLTYYNNAQLVLRNETFQNEVQRVVDNLIKDIARNSTSYEDVRDLRMTINGIEAIVKRLESIPDPTKKQTKDRIYDVI